MRKKIAFICYALTVILCLITAVKYSNLSQIVIGLTLFLALGLVPSSLLLSRSKIKLAIVELAVISTLIAISFFAISGFVYSLTKSFFLGTIPIIALCLSGYFFLFSKLKKNVIGFVRLVADEKTSTWVGLSSITLISNGFLLGTLDKQPLTWSGNWDFYPDVMWQVSIVSENLSRPLEVFPYVLGVPFEYPWALHSFLSFWANISSASAWSTVAVLWPTLFALVGGAALFALGRSITKSNLIATATALVILTTGQMRFIGSELAAPVFYYSASPTFELGLLFLIGLWLIGAQIGKAKISLLAGLVVQLLVFCATATKSSNGPIIIISIIGLVTVLLLKKVNNIPKANWFWAGGAILSALLSYFIFVSGTSGVVEITPLSFLADNFANNKVVALSIILIYLLISLGSFYVISKFINKNITAWALLIPSAFGLFVTAVLGHPGKSQLYFLWTVSPFILLMLVTAIGALHHKKLLGSFFIAFSISIITPELFSMLQITQDRVLFLQPLLVLFLCVAGSCSVLFLIFPQSPHKALLPIICISLLGLAGLQVHELRQVTYSSASETLTSSSISDKDAELLISLKENSSQTDVVATNKHCMNVPDNQVPCDGKAFFISAISERRTLVSGWSFTPKGNVFWDQTLLTMNDSFFTTPDLSGYQSLKSKGIEWLIQDTTISTSDLSEFANLVNTGTTLQLWKMK